MTGEHTTRRRAKLWAAGVAAGLLVCAGLVAVGLLRDYVPDIWRVPAGGEASKHTREKPRKPNYELAGPAIQPSASSGRLVKPGHWATAAQRLTANDRDFVGRALVTLVDEDNDLYPVDRTPFFLQSNRPVALARGTPKNLETVFLVPQVSDEVRLVTALEDRRLGAVAGRWPTKLAHMPSYQYHFVVLAADPFRYTFLKTLDSVQVPFDGETEFDNPGDTLHYRVQLMQASGQIPLSDNPLTWTSIAYILWDDVDPQLFTAGQQRALVDWLHWGGQLIVNGPDSLDRLKGSFLGPYLPATSSGSRQIDAAQLAELNRGWTISTERAPGQPLASTVAWSGIGLALHRDARVLWSTGGLLVERRVGRGRIVVSAMRLAERELVNWRSGFESLFNACVFRRPPRVYRQGYFGGLTLAWADRELTDRRLDARLTTGLRYFARDAGVATSYRWVDAAESKATQLGGSPTANQPTRQYEPPLQPGGIGAWNDFSAVANAARDSLREAAGVEVPRASFVVTLLIVYLIALVPLNWLVFRTVGRIEWAWLAAPALAVVSTFVVVHLARLNIGFARAQTEIGLLEVQPEHPRGLLTRYTALYTSLSTTYNVESDDITTLAAPFPAGADFRLLHGQKRQSVDFQPYSRVRLSGLPVTSNSAELVHSEQMVALDGPVRLVTSSDRHGGRLENHSQFKLRSVGIVRRPIMEQGTLGEAVLEGMWIGTLKPSQSTAVVYLPPLRLDEGEVPFADERAAESRLVEDDQLNLESLFAVAYDVAHLEEGETRLVARIDEVLPPGETFEPAASQTRGATLVVVHLRYAPLPDPRPDKNTRQDVTLDAPTQ